jgi:hypothetical protein
MAVFIYIYIILWLYSCCYSFTYFRLKFSLTVQSRFDARSKYSIYAIWFYIWLSRNKISIGFFYPKVSGSNNKSLFIYYISV